MRLGAVQAVRLHDVLLLGPFLVWAGGRRAGPLPGWARAALVAAGLGTIVYNGANYLAARKRS